mmetsp:Transcript_77749/g.137796  ORF Transcript_77749/g.137796 Transcript_77749/m.137796 type:complete len:271 (+) Transcript_77749:1705-2517(+)
MRVLKINSPEMTLCKKRQLLAVEEDIINLLISRLLSSELSSLALLPLGEELLLLLDSGHLLLQLQLAGLSSCLGLPRFPRVAQHGLLCFPRLLLRHSSLLRFQSLLLRCFGARGASCLWSLVRDYAAHCNVPIIAAFVLLDDERTACAQAIWDPHLDPLLTTHHRHGEESAWRCPLRHGQRDRRGRCSRCFSSGRLLRRFLRLCCRSTWRPASSLALLLQPGLLQFSLLSQVGLFSARASESLSAVRDYIAHHNVPVFATFHLLDDERAA